MSSLLNSNTNVQDGDRLQREKEFHNQRFTEENRLKQKKYYQAIRPCFDQYHERLTKLAHGADVLEYGCAKGEGSLKLASTAKSVTGIDISDVAIEQGNAAAKKAGLGNVTFRAMNAEAMTFPDESFDLVFGSGIIHHLDVERSLSDVRRVLRPSGVALFCEPLGHNWLINAYRNRTPEARTPDEHPLLRKDFLTAQKIFGRVDVTYFGLTTLGALALVRTPLGGVAMNMAGLLDQVLFRLPVVRWQAWYTLMQLRR